MKCKIMVEDPREVFEMRCLRAILGVYLLHKIRQRLDMTGTIVEVISRRVLE